MLTVEVAGQRFSEFIDISVDTALDKFAWEFFFKVASNIPFEFNIKIGQEVKIYADEILIFTGYVEKSRVWYNTQKHEIQVRGRSKTADLVDSTIDGRVQFDVEVNLETIAKKLVNYLFTDELFDSGIRFENEDVTAEFLANVPRKQPPLNVVVEPGVDNYTITEVNSEDLGATYFETLEKFAIKRQLLLTTNSNSDIVFTRGLGTPSRLILRNRKGSPNNNIQEATFTQDASKRFFIYSCISQGTKGGLVTLAEVPTDQLYIQNGRTIDNTIRRVSRKLYFVSENPSDQKQCESRSAWEREIRTSRSMRYQASTQGHSYNGVTWGINKLVSVDDEFAGIQSNLLLDRVIFRQTLKGSQTLISALPPNAYTFPRKDIPGSDNLGDEFLGIPLHVAPFGSYSEKDLEKIFPGFK